MPRRITGFMAAAALQIVAVVLAHDLVFLARFGSRYGEALAHSGHGESWSTAVGTTLVIAALLALAGISRLALLGVLVRRTETGSATRSGAAVAAGTLEGGALLRLWLRIAPRIAIVSVASLTVQENLERASIGGPVPGPGILLSPEYPAAFWITIAVGLVVGLVAALFEWRRRALLARLRAVRAVLPRHAPGIALRPGRTPARPVISVLGRRSGLRAPPQPSLA